MSFISISTNTYSQQLDEKISLLQSYFSQFNLNEPEVFTSPESYYRMRCEFRVWHDGDDLFHIMFDPQTKEKIRIDQYLVASKLINQLMAELIEAIKPIEILRKRLFQIDYLSTQSGEILVSLLYHKPLCDEWQSACSKLKSEFSSKYHINFVGRAKKQKFIIDKDYVIENLSVCGQQYTYQQVENSFTQPNAAICESMLTWVKNAIDYEGDLLELYCGNGNFSIALADKFNKVLATEISKSSVASAQFNIKANNIQNLDIIRMSAEEFTQAINKERAFNRLKDINLDDYHCETILVDPPRSGLDNNTLEMVSKYKYIIYISCNPETLKSNLESLIVTHQVEKFAAFDQFPYTHHLEVGLILKKRI